MNFSDQTQKHIGTFVPLYALRSKTHSQKENGTFASGGPFLEWLQRTGQSLWQLLPLHTTQLEPNALNHVSSPYKGYGIGLDPRYLPESFVTLSPTPRQKSKFLKDHQEWIGDYALFCALRDHFHTDDWRTWEKGLPSRDLIVIKQWSKTLAQEIDAHICMQWRLHEAYTQLRNTAKKLDITLSGDLPFYLSLHSPLVWAHQDAFEIGDEGSMSVVSGVTDLPPSFFGRQVWGHPLYAWERKENWDVIVSLWKLRLRYMAKLYDSLRFDYAEAFYHYGVMSTSDSRHDIDRSGPGSTIFEELVRFAQALGIFVFAEDSGTQPDEMKRSLKNLSCPSIRIYCFTAHEAIERIPELSVVYTTTHDTETLVGYLGRLSVEQKKQIARAASVTYASDDSSFAQALRRAVITSHAQVVIVPIQDWLLTTERINIPGTETAVDDPNWRFQMTSSIEDLPQSLV
jgi:4-alpha-glucanotransferase